MKGFLQKIDAYQQRHAVLAFPVAIIKKFGDDEAGNLAALIAYYGFFSLFPLLMVLVTVLGMVLKGNEELQQKIVDSALAHFPVIGDQISQNVHSLTGSGWVLALGILLTLWAGLGVLRATQTAMNKVWGVPREERPNFLASNLRALLMLAVLGVLTVAAALAGSITGGSGSSWWYVLGIGLSLGLNLALFLLLFRILTTAELTWSDVFPGAAVGAVGWTLLQLFGGYIVSRRLQGASQIYGAFAVVIGLLAWIFLGAQLTLYAAEVNVVRKYRLWPRSLTGPAQSEPDDAGRPQVSEPAKRR
jgi:membrane protein